MAYKNNQYLKLDKPIEEIAKIEIKTYEKNKLIEDIEIGDYVNVVIAYGKRVVYNNIYGGIKILITDEEALIKNEYIIPEYIEKIIVYGCVYENNKREIERFKNSLELINAIKDKNERLALELLEREDINVNYVDKYGQTALIWACINGIESVAFKLLEKEGININQVNDRGETALMYACWNKMEIFALKLLEREDIDINHVNKYGNTALMCACSYKMETVALKLLEREDININQVNINGVSALFFANKNGMEQVVNRINELNKK